MGNPREGRKRTPKLSDEEVIGIRPTEVELGILAEHHLDVAWDMFWDQFEFEQSSPRCNRIKARAERRLDEIARVLGREKFEAATRHVENKWLAKREAFWEAIRTAAPCAVCGKPRSKSSIVYNDPYCEECRADPRRRRRQTAESEA